MNRMPSHLTSVSAVLVWATTVGVALTGCIASTFGLSEGAIAGECAFDDDCPKPDAVCKVARCDPMGHQCTIVDSEAGAACSDGSVCTVDDACSAGSCVSKTGPGPVELSTIAESRGGYSMDGEAAFHSLGWSVAGLGDMNGDGTPDFVIGAPDAGPEKFLDPGRGYVVFGSDGPSFALTDLVSSARGFIIEGEADGHGLGWAVASAGDFNGDNVPDVAVSAPHASIDGRVYVVYGKADDAPVSTALLGPGQGLWVEDEVPDGFFGGSIDVIGDADTDGFDDIVIGNPLSEMQRGRIYILRGDTQRSSGYPGDLILGEVPGRAAGYDVAGVGDINGDGAFDIAVSSEYVSASQQEAGKVYVIFGGKPPSSAAFADVAQGMGGFAVVGVGEGDFLGHSLSGAGDFDNDGFNDLILGAWGVSDESGAAYIFFGSDAPASGPLLASDGLEIASEAVGSRFGQEVAGLGDVNGDGFDDVAIAAPLFDVPGKQDAGRVYVIFGGPSRDSIGAADIAEAKGGFAINGEVALDGFMSAIVAIAGPGDINKDGFDDILIGIPGHSPAGKELAGRAYLVFGGQCQ